MSVTPYRGYTEIPGAATPDVPYRVNLALREVDADMQDTERKLNARLSLLERGGAEGDPLEVQDEAVGAILSDPRTASAQAVDRLAQAAAQAAAAKALGDNPQWIGPLAPWGAALLGHRTKPCIFVSVGSSTANGGITSRPEYAWPQRVAARITGNPMTRLEASGARPANGVWAYTGAVGGTTSKDYLTDDMVAKIKTLRPTLITHMVGSNDYMYNWNPDTTAANLRTWINKIRTASPESVHVLIHQQTRHDVRTPAHPWEAYGEALRTVAGEYPNVLFLDADAPFTTLGLTRTTDRGQLLDVDICHMNDRGHRIMADLIADYLGVPMNYRTETIWFTGAWNGGDKTAKTGTLATLKIPAAPYPRLATLRLDVFARAQNADVELRLGGQLGFRIRVAGARDETWNGTAVMPVPANTAVDFTADWTLNGGAIYFSGGNGYSEYNAMSAMIEPA